MTCDNIKNIITVHNRTIRYTTLLFISVSKFMITDK